MALVKQNCRQFEFDITYAGGILKQRVLAGTHADAWLKICVLASELTNTTNVRYVRDRAVTITIEKRA